VTGTVTVVLLSFTVTNALPGVIPLTVTTLPDTETVATLVADELAMTVPETLLAVRMALDRAAMLKDVGDTVIALDAMTVTATLARPDRASRTDMVVLPAPWPSTASVAPEFVTFESVTVATAVLPDCA
jgi:hypothetical protein